MCDFEGAGEFEIEYEPDGIQEDAVCGGAWEDDCPLDGDEPSALASIGWGTDEDYGGDTHEWEESWGED